MKAKIVFHFALVVMLATFATGCATSTLINKSKETTADTFTPLAVYSTANYDKFTLKGKVEYANGKRALQTFMMLPQGSSTNFQENIIYLTKIGNKVGYTYTYNEDGLKVGLFRTLQHLPTSVSTNMIQTNALPPFYYKMSDIYPNMDRPKENVDGSNYYSDKVRFGIKEHHPSRWVIVFIPFTAAIDIATSPIQIPVIILLEIFPPHINC